MIKKTAPDILDTELEVGIDILHRKKPLKSVAKGALSCASWSLMKNTRESFEQELADHGRRGKKKWWTHVEEESEDGGKQKKEAIALNFKTKKNSAETCVITLMSSMYKKRNGTSIHNDILGGST